MKTSGNIKKPEVSSKLTKQHTQYSTSKNKKKHRRKKQGITAPYGIFGVESKHYNF
jgi:hypothetical protein